MVREAADQYRTDRSLPMLRGALSGMASRPGYLLVLSAKHEVNTWIYADTKGNQAWRMLSKAAGTVSFPQEYHRELFLNQECSPADLTGGPSCFFLVHACAFVDLNIMHGKFGTYLLVKQPHLRLEDGNRLASGPMLCSVGPENRAPP